MKRILLAAAMVTAGYYLYDHYVLNVGAYAEDGTPLTLFFSTEQCGKACNDMRRYLKSRVPFEEYDAFDNGPGRELYEKYGGAGFLPYTVIGKQRVTGPDRGDVISAVATEFGLEKVKARERKALQRNFDENGKARVVMYATEWCGYCEQARQYFAEQGVDYVELDIEKDRGAKRDFDALLGSGTPLLYHGYDRMVGFHPRKVDGELNL